VTEIITRTEYRTIITDRKSHSIVTFRTSSYLISKTEVMVKTCTRIARYWFREISENVSHYWYYRYYR